MAMGALITGIASSRLGVIAARCGQLLLGAVFLSSGLEKALHIQGFAAFLSAQVSVLRIGPAFSTTTALVVCVVEVVLGSALITGWRSRHVVLIGMGLVSAFGVFLLTLMARDVPVASCGCGRIASLLQAQSEGAGGALMRNAVFVLVFAWIAIVNPIGWSRPDRA